eukprot:5458660-Heterocapsa_arctica.AAC.1
MFLPCHFGGIFQAVGHPTPAEHPHNRLAEDPTLPPGSGSPDLPVLPILPDLRPGRPVLPDDLFGSRRRAVAGGCGVGLRY